MNGIRWSAFVAVAALCACAGPQELSFPSDDGGIVYADAYGSGRHAVVLAHGGRFNRSSWRDQAMEFADAGYRVIAFDFRRRDAEAYRDVLAAVRAARAGGASTVSVIGASFGGTAAARASVAAPGEIDRLVLLAAPADEPGKLGGRKLLIVARGDVRGDGMMRLPMIERQFARMPEPKRLVVVEGIAHAQYLFESVHAERVMQEVRAFLAEP